MLCLNCHQDSPSTTVCVHCGASLLITGAPAPTIGPLVSQPRNSATHPLKTIFFIGTTIVAWIAIAYITYLRTIRWSKGVSNAETYGFFIGAVLAPFLVATFFVWIINRAQSDKLSLLHRQVITAVLTLGITVISFAGSLRRAPRSEETTAEKRIGHLMKQAAGKEAATPDAEWYEGPTREFFHDILVFNQEYTGKVHAIGPSVVPKLYTPESYATRASMQNTISQLRALLEVDKKYESMDPLVKKLEVNISATSASQFEKEEFIKGFRTNFSKSLAPRGETFRAEEEWLQSSIELYEFTLAHSGDFRVQGKKVFFRENELRDQFQALQSKCIALRKATIDAKNKLDASRKAALSQTGVTPADISAPAAKEK